jgi:hypothetical protein
MGLSLDRMALDDVGANPARIAGAIHDQLKDVKGAVPVFEVAMALDILDIRIEPLTTFEGALVTTAERGEGSILLNKNASRQRQRFTAGHELLHFLSPIHRPTSEGGFWCSRADMTERRLDAQDLHQRQEAEANVFAIELLAPRSHIKPYLRRAPSLGAVMEMASSLDISKEAAARRYVECHGETLAVVFSRNGRVLYFDVARDFPRLALGKGMSLPKLTGGSDETPLGAMEEVPADDWLSTPSGVEMEAQTLQQQNGYAMTLLHVLPDEDDEDMGIEDAYDRFTRSGS